ncbi:MAG: hypothetical protein M1840_007063 [Geoglossum simile]|nr:MAG: hypothetical protein M1840_007063 [Geoglossum simile]
MSAFRRQRTEEEFDRLMIRFTLNPGFPRRWGGEEEEEEEEEEKEEEEEEEEEEEKEEEEEEEEEQKKEEEEEDKLPPEPVPELEIETVAGDAGNIYLIDSKNSGVEHPMRILPVPGNGNCFWAAFASAYYGDETQWARVKLQTLSYFRAVMSNANHPRHRLYQSLNNMTDQDGSSVDNQLAGLNVWTSAETAQVVADLFDVELIMVYKLPGSPQAGPIFRGLHNRQQVFLYLNNVHWVGLKPVGVFPSDFRLEHQAAFGECRTHVTELDGSFKVPRALVPCPRIPQVLVRDVKRLFNAVRRREASDDLVYE